MYMRTDRRENVVNVHGRFGGSFVEQEAVFVSVLFCILQYKFVWSIMIIFNNFKITTS